MKWLAPLLVFLAGCAGCASFGSYRSLDAVALLIESDNGSCSATAVGPHTLATADHCLMAGPIVAVNGQPVKVLHVERDGNDHALVKVDMTFSVWARIGRPVIGERVRMLGNPSGFRKIYREGLVAGLNETPCPRFETVTPKLSCTTLIFQMPVGQGDSGAGYFDTSGLLVAIHSASVPIAGSPDGDAYQAVPVALSLAFTPEQWKAAGV